MRQTGGLCFWCKKPIVMLRTIEPHEIVKRLPKSIYWRDVDGELLFAMIATIDHLDGLVDKSSNHPEKLVASCLGCNNFREVGPQSERSQKRNEEIKKEASIYRPLFRWLRRQNAHLVFGPQVRCFVEVDGVIVADCTNSDPIGAILGAQRIYNEWYMKKNGIAGRPQLSKRMEAPKAEDERAAPPQEGTA